MINHKVPLFPKDTPLFLLCLLVISCSLSYYYDTLGLPVLPEGPTRRVGEVARSIADHGSLQPPELKVYIEQISQKAKAGGSESRYQDFFSLGKNGEIYPKHSLFSGVFGAPFYFLLGPFGFSVAQQLLVLFLGWGTFQICSRFTRSSPLLVCLTGLLLFTPLFYGLYAHTYSYDLHGAALIVGGTALMSWFSFFGAFVLGLSIFVRPNTILLFPLLILLPKIDSSRVFLWRLLGVSAAGILFLLSNHYLYGSPFLTAYHRLPEFLPDGSYEIAPHAVGFSFTQLISQLWIKLFGIDKGLFGTCPLWFLFPFVLWWGKSHLLKQYIHLTFAVSVVTILYVFSYPMWNANFMASNRFLLPGVLIFFPLVLAYIHEQIIQFSKSEHPNK